jgi:hypothetical protein
VQLNPHDQFSGLRVPRFSFAAAKAKTILSIYDFLIVGTEGPPGAGVAEVNLKAFRPSSWSKGLQLQIRGLRVRPSIGTTEPYLVRSHKTECAALRQK